MTKKALNIIGGIVSIISIFLPVLSGTFSSYMREDGIFVEEKGTYFYWMHGLVMSMTSMPLG